MTALPPLRRQVVVPAGAELAFETFTGDIGSWWPLGEGFSVFGAGATVGLRERRLVEVAPDGREALWGTVLDWDPPSRVRLTWHPGQDAATATELEVSFVEVVDGQTLVTLEHRGWERLADPAAGRAEYGKGWRRVLGLYADGTPVTKGAEDGAVWFALSHTPGPALEPGGNLFRHPDFAEHLAFLRRLLGQGVLIAAGPLDGGVNGEGMTVVRLADATGVAELVRCAQDDDLSVARGLLQVRVRPWQVALSG
jgi:uncharacterized protein YndB with AHSA1/START domain/uncharacterized protein YciI